MEIEHFRCSRTPSRTATIKNRLNPYLIRSSITPASMWWGLGIGLYHPANLSPFRLESDTFPSAEAVI